MTDAMATRIDELRRPAGALLLWQPVDDGSWQRLFQGEHVQEEAERLFDAIRTDVKRIAHADSRPALDRAVKDTMPGYMMRKGELFALLLESIPDRDLEELWAMYEEATQAAQRLIQTEASTYLDNEAIDRFEQAVNGAVDYSETVLRLIFSEGWNAVNAAAVDRTMDAFVRVDLLLMTAFLLIKGELDLDTADEDVAGTVALLAEEADRGVDHIEATLLETDPELQRRIGQERDTDVPLEDYRQARGLA